MRDTELYRHLLGLESPWTVARVELDLKDQRVDVPGNGRARRDAHCTVDKESCTPYTYAGVTLEWWEYERYEDGSSPVFTPLRFPGQYHDEETDLFENWNRYYDPMTGGYLQPEPMMQEPDFIRARALVGMSTPAYPYASNNPISRYDPNGNLDLGTAAGAAVGEVVGGASGAAAGAAVGGGLSISAASVWPICASTGNYYYEHHQDPCCVCHGPYRKFGGCGVAP